MKNPPHWVCELGRVALPLTFVSLVAAAAAGIATPLFCLAIGARTGGAEVLKPTIRVTFWGALAMAATAAIGALLGTVV